MNSRDLAVEAERAGRPATEILQEHLRRRVPARRMGEPEEVAAAFAFLASDEAAFVTGQTLVIDGGESIA
jgi:3-oxoacyl-[acyl-carrier protein] reductase